MFSKDDFEGALKVIGLSFFEEFEFVFGLDGDGFADFRLFHFILVNLSFINAMFLYRLSLSEIYYEETSHMILYLH